jgi:DNA-directed RNA polymerase
MESFLSRPLSVTTLNPPLPVGVKAPTPSSNTPIEPAIQTDTATQDKLAVISACLYNNADVGRAKAIFDLLRSERQGDPLLSTKMYNQVLNAYLEMAEKESNHRMLWVEEACALFAAMRDGLDSVQPNAGTYAIMLQTWIK